jgi:hypothetical protein
MMTKKISLASSPLATEDIRAMGREIESRKVKGFRKTLLRVGPLKYAG